MCEKGALWVEGSKPVSQEAASLPRVSSFEKKKKKTATHQGSRVKLVVTNSMIFHSDQDILRK